MKKSQEHLRADVPAALNPAKRYAGQLVGRWVTVMGAGILAPVARRWKAQLNENAKAMAEGLLARDRLRLLDELEDGGTLPDEDATRSGDVTGFELETVGDQRQGVPFRLIIRALGPRVQLQLSFQVPHGNLQLPRQSLWTGARASRPIRMISSTAGMKPTERLPSSRMWLV